jgi:hypothetical protein
MLGRFLGEVLQLAQHPAGAEPGRRGQDTADQLARRLRFTGHHPGAGQADHVEHPVPKLGRVPQGQRALDVLLGEVGLPRIVPGQVAQPGTEHPFELRLVEGGQPVRLVHRGAGAEALPGHAHRAVELLRPAHLRVRPCLPRVEHRAQGGRGTAAGAVLAELHQLKPVLGAAEVEHLPGHGRQAGRGERVVPPRLGHPDGQHVVALRGLVQARVPRHGRGDLGQLRPGEERLFRAGPGRCPVQPLGELVELAEHGLAGQARPGTAAPGAQPLGNLLQRRQLVVADHGPGRPLGQRLQRVEPVLQRFDQGRPYCYRGRSAERRSSADRQVVPRRFLDRTGDARRVPWRSEHIRGGSGSGVNRLRRPPAVEPQPVRRDAEHSGEVAQLVHPVDRVLPVLVPAELCLADAQPCGQAVLGDAVDVLRMVPVGGEHGPHVPVGERRGEHRVVPELLGHLGRTENLGPRAPPAAVAQSVRIVGGDQGSARTGTPGLGVR